MDALRHEFAAVRQPSRVRADAGPGGSPAASDVVERIDDDVAQGFFARNLSRAASQRMQHVAITIGGERGFPPGSHVYATQESTRVGTS